MCRALAPRVGALCKVPAADRLGGCAPFGRLGDSTIDPPWRRARRTSLSLDIGVRIQRRLGGAVPGRFSEDAFRCRYYYY